MRHRQTSFALGRPDSLGPDQYHTQHLPTEALADTATGYHVVQIVPCMVSLSRIMRKAALDLYTQSCEMVEKIARAKSLEEELSQWLGQVPAHLVTDQVSSQVAKVRRLPSYIKKQSVVLRLRK